ncbi:uncharacterized protein LOC124166108 [Ischnura elegans]|uniref:uncharacterized protein LOC124166108 n=1 Tax=Ischnura elegans TaxID=197161 RepID=UPI001ED8729A|nr:uncharacterized protein LOC124166108 [Ischnura elegans]
MDEEEVWEKFLPKTKRGNLSSNLSQMSSSSCFSKDGRLSLSTRVGVRESWKIGGLQNGTAVTPPKPSTSKMPYVGTPSPKIRTPSNRRKSSSKKSIPSDGKTQKSLLSYFPVSSSKKSEPLQVSCNILEITLSDSDEETFRDIKLDKSTERKTLDSSGVSRVLFPSASSAVGNDGGETSVESGMPLSPARGSDKENQLSSPIAWSVANNPEDASLIKSGVKKKTLAVVHPVGDATYGKGESIKTNQQTFSLTAAPEIISPVEAPSKGNRVSPTRSLTDTTSCLIRESDKGAKAVFTFKSKCKSPEAKTVPSELSQVREADHEDTITSLAASYVRPECASSVAEAVNQLGTSFKTVENQPKPQDRIDKGKGKVNTPELSKVSRKTVVYHKGVTYQTVDNSQSSVGNINSNLRKDLKSWPLLDAAQSPRHYASTCEPLLEKQKHPPMEEPTENFTGVTECVSYPSSGDVWTPAHLSSLSSDDFDSTNGEKAARSKKPSKRNRAQSNERNRTKKTDKNKRKVSGTKGKAKVTREDGNKGSHKNISKDIDSRDVSKVSLAQSSSYTASDIVPTEEGLKNSGGFLPSNADENRIPGQAFVIKFPSIEYLVNYGSVEDTSFVIENDMACGDSSSEKSSVVADIKDIDAAIANSSSNTVKVNDPDESANIDGVSERGNFSASTVGIMDNIKNVNSQESLRGVTITESEWNRLPSQTNVNQALTAKSFSYSVGDACESLASAPCNFQKKPNQIENSFSSQSELFKGRQSSQDMLTERAVSPSEAEEAPVNDIAGMRQNVSQQGASNKAVMSPHSYCISSQSTEIRLTSAIDPMPPPETVQNVSPYKEDKAERLASTEKVLKWMSKLKINPVINLVSAEITKDQCETLGKGSSGSGIKVRGGTTLAELCKIPSREKQKSKFCHITCQVKVMISFSNESDGKRVEVIRKDCDVRGKNRHSLEKFRKSSASFAVEIYDIPNVMNLQANRETSKNHLRRNGSIGSAHANARTLHNHVKNSMQKTEFKNISANVKGKYGHFGWNEIEIECLDGVFENSISSSLEEQIDSSNLSIQKVKIYLCKCSRSMVVECIVLQNDLGLDNNSVVRSKFHTSLKEYESRWGVPDDPVTLTAVAYSKISSCFYPESLSNDVEASNSCMVAEPNISDSLGQIMHTVSDDFSEDSNNGYSQEKVAGKRKPTRLPSQISNLLRDDESLSMSDLDAIPTDSSDLEWVTQESEASKSYDVGKWQSLMQKMRNGEKLSKSKPASSAFPGALSSSFASSSSQGFTQSSLESRGSYGHDRKPKACPFFRKIEGTRFAVDAFNFGSIPGITYYFLSHFHYDHYIGLKKSFSHHIYCSSVTGKLVASKLGVRPELIRRIDPGQTIKVDGVVITALDANHCPGSIMLLFQLPTGETHLHVGDFRAHLGMESFHAFWNVHVKNLYLDTTYCNPTYTFPSQERVIDNVLSIVESAVSKNPKTLIVCGTYTIGKERVFAAIAERFQFKIWAPPEKRRVLECVRGGLQELRLLDKDSPDISEGGAARELNLIGALNMLTMVKETAQIHVLPMAKIKQACLLDHLKSMKSSAFTSIIAFRPTGWAHGHMKGDNESNVLCNSPSVKIYEVAYSEHSSFLELARFVKFIKPEKVVKTVGGSDREREAMDKHINSWLREARSKVPLPNRSCDSPKSSQVAMQQREAGEFVAKRKNNLLARRFNTSQGSLMKFLGSDTVQTLVDSNTSSKSDFESRKTERTSSIQSQLHNGSRKRLGSPSGSGSAPKRYHS